MALIDQSASESELHFLYDTVRRCRGSSVGRDNAWEVAPVLCSIPYSVNAIHDLEVFERAVNIELPQLCTHGRNRAAKAFQQDRDTITKPSYIARLTSGCTWSLLVSQRDTLVKTFMREPLSGGLVFSVFHPRDLIDRHRPGYVPCLISGTFLLHKQRLHLSAFFRSQSILEFGIYDLLFLRRFQQQFLDSIAAIPRDAVPKRIRPKYHVRPGPLNLQFSRVVVPSRLARNRKGFVRRSDILDRWLELLVQTIETTDARFPHPWEKARENIRREPISDRCLNLDREKSLERML